MITGLVAVGIPVKLDDNSTFPGRGHEHAIDITGHGRLTGVFSDTRAGRGEHVGLRLDPRGMNGASRSLNRALTDASNRALTGASNRVSNRAGQAWNCGGRVRSRPSRLVTVSHLGSDHA